MDNCYNCEHLTIGEHRDYRGYEIDYSFDCEFCDMRTKDHSRPCCNHKVGDPKHVVYNIKKD